MHFKYENGKLHGEESFRVLSRNRISRPFNVLKTMTLNYII